MEGSFVGPQMRHIINDKQFDDLLVGPVKITWKEIKDVVENYVSNYRAIQLVDKLLIIYKTMKCNTLLKLHFLHSHLV